MTKKVKRYSEEFKAEAVKAIENNGGNVSGTARQLGLPMQKLANWQRKANQGKLKGTKQFDSELMAVIEENKRLKRELKIAQEEREILKKATAYFARNGPDLSTNLSSRQLRRIFNFYIGTTPKEFSNVVRFQYILNATPSKQTLKNDKLYLDLGFFDQAHFIKSFKSFYGITPSKAFL